MVKRIIILSILSVFLCFQVKACDVCGSSVSGTGLGLLSAYRYNFISLSYQLLRFEGSTLHGSGSIDHFHMMELSMRYHLTDRFKVLAHQPYRYNHRLVENEVQTLQGLGDTRILGSYTLIQDQELGKSWKIFTELNGGVQLPIGAYDADLHAKDLPENFNLGQGSWAFLLQPNVIISRSRYGFIINGTYQYNRPSRSGYQFGHQASGQVVFYAIKTLKNDWTLTPYAGAVGEKIQQDQYANGNWVGGTSGHGIFANMGLNLKFNNWMGSFAYSHPISTLYSLGEVHTKGRLRCQLAYVF